MKSDILIDAEFDRQHRDWMAVTNSAVNQQHCSNGYKGQQVGIPVRPQFIQKHRYRGALK